MAISRAPVNKLCGVSLYKSNTQVMMYYFRIFDEYQFRLAAVCGAQMWVVYDCIIYYCSKLHMNQLIYDG